MNKTSVIMILGILLLVSSAFAITGSIGNARVVLSPEYKGTPITIERTILVKNVNDEPLNITITPDPKYDAWFTIVDKEFMLEPQTEKNARFQLHILDPYQHEIKVAVAFTPEDGPGVVLGSTMIIVGTEENPNPETETTLPLSTNVTSGPATNETQEQTTTGDNDNGGGMTISPGGKIPDSNTNKGPNPITGILVFVVILVCGGVIYILVKMMMGQKKGPAKRKVGGKK